MKKKKNFKLILSFLVTASMMFGAFHVINIKLEQAYAPKSSVVTKDYISGKLESISKLAVTKTTYEGIVEVTDSKSFFNKRLYLCYKAYLKAYVNLEDADINIDNQTRTIFISIPHAELGEPNIDDTNYSLYDATFFEVENQEAITTALSQAEDDCLNVINEEVMIEAADEAADKAVRRLMSSFEKLEEPYTVEISMKE